MQVKRSLCEQGKRASSEKRDREWEQGPSFNAGLSYFWRISLIAFSIIVWCPEAIQLDDFPGRLNTLRSPQSFGDESYTRFKWLPCEPNPTNCAGNFQFLSLSMIIALNQINGKQANLPRKRCLWPLLLPQTNAIAAFYSESSIPGMQWQPWSADLLAFR